MRQITVCDVEHSYEVPAGPSAPRQARAVLDALSDRLRPERLDEARLLISELVTNSVRHGGGPDGMPIRIDIEVRGHRLRVAVVDQGQGFVRALRGQRASAPGAGWGLAILERVANRWGIAREDGTAVWFEIESACSSSEPVESRRKQ